MNHVEITLYINELRLRAVEETLAREGKSVEEIIKFMDENERTLSQNPFARRSKPSVIIPEEKAEEKKAEEQVEKTETEQVDKDQPSQE